MNRGNIFQFFEITLTEPKYSIMKKLIGFLFAFLVFHSGFSQDFFKGPKAKNAVLTKSQVADFSLVFNPNPERPKGAAAKSYKVWNKESSKLQIRTRKEINNPKGLNAKNHKVWEKEEPKVDSKAVYELPKSMKRRKSWWH